MKKFTLNIFMIVFLLGSYVGVSQVLNQAASWPNAGWTLSGTYTGAGLLSDPTVDGSTFTFDDDAAGNGSFDDIQATSPVIDLTAANGAGETWITISGDFVYRALAGDVLALEIYDADALTWSAVETFAGNSTNTDFETCASTAAYTTAIIDISGYTATQLSGFQYRFSYDDGNNWQWGWCFTSPTIVSAAPPSCIDPSTLTATGITESAADLGWTENGTATAWDVEIVDITAAGTPTGTPTAAGVTNPYAASGLSGDNDYEFYVRADCGGLGTSAWVGPFAFSTPVPDPTCANGTFVDSGGVTGDYGSGENITYTICPDNPGDVVSVEFTFFSSENNGTSCYDGLTIHNGPDALATTIDPPAGGTVWCWDEDDFTPNGSGDLDGITIMSTDVSGCITFVFTSDGSVQREGWEAIVTCAAPPACFDPSALTANNIAATSADLGWTENGTATAWDVEIVDVTAAGTATGTPTATGVTNPYSATGLTPENDYEFYVRADCGVDGTSAWIGPFAFTTIEACPAPSALTATNIMETSADLGWTENGSATSWNVEIVDLTAGGTATGTPTASGVTNPYAAAGLVGDNNYEYYVQADCGVDGVSDWSGPFAFTTPYVAVAPDCTNGTFLDSGGVTGDYGSGENITYTICPGGPGEVVSVEFTFFSSENNGTACYDGLTIHNGPDALATTIDPPAGGTIWCWDEDDFTPNGSGDLDGMTIVSTDATGCITFVFTSDGSVQREGWEAIVTCIPAPTCTDVSAISVSNITTTTADVAWTNAGSESAWEVAIQAQGTGEPGAADGSGADTASNPYNATGLMSSTSYEVWVRAECTAGTDFGGWVGPIDFATLCDTYSLPLVEGFESGVPPTCWDSFRGTNGEGTGFDWTTTAVANSGASAAFVRYENVATGAEDWLVTPALDMSTATNPELSFFASEDFATDYGTTYTIRVSTTDTDHASFTTVQTYTEADFSTDNYDQYIVDLSAYASEATVYVAFVMAQDDGDNWLLDDVLIWDNVPTTFTYTSGTWAPFDPMGVASSDDDVVIAAGSEVMSSDLSCNTLTVNPGAGLTVDTGVTITTVGGTMMESSSTSYSSLILDGTVVGPMSYERHVNINGTGTTGSNDLVSAPLTGQAFSALATANPNILNNGTLYLFGPFEKVNGQYVNWAGTETSTLDPGVGYRAATSDNSVVTFTGTANNGVVTNDLINGGVIRQEWNLVGNPYPSYINVLDFLNHDVGGVTNIQLFDAPTAAIWGYDGSALNGWTIYNLATASASTVMTPGQGFFVSADATNTGPYDLEFTPAMRTTGTSDDFIAGRNAELLYLTLSLSSNTNEYGTDFYFNANASEGFDRGYDAAVWGDEAPAFAIYSRLVQDDAGDAIALQALKNTDFENVTIPLGVNANQGEQITFRIHESTLPENVKVYLDDTVENTTTLLNDSDYVITPSAELSGTGRFFLRYEQDGLSTIDNGLEQLDIFTLNDSDELVVSGELKDNASLELFDIQGRKVLTVQLDNTLLQNRINVSNINTGIYLATVNDNSQEITKKVIIK